MQEQLQSAMQAQRRGDIAGAEKAFVALLDSSKGHPVVQAQYATLLCQTGRAREALPRLQAAINGLPQEKTLLQQSIQIAMQLSEHTLAKDWCQRLIALEGETPELLERLAGLEIAQHQEAEALTHIKQVLKQQPQNANALNLKGLALSRLGDTERGYKCFQKSVKLAPGNLGAVRNLLTYGKGKQEPLLEQIVPQLQQSLRQPKLDPIAKMNIAYIVAMYFEKRHPAISFEALSLANQINRQQYQYAHNTTLAQFEQLLNTFDEAFIEAAKADPLDEEGPLFVLGMPRSGTTLVEQILSSHSKVEAEGEIIDLRQCVEQEAAALFGEGTVESRVAAGKRALKAYLASVRARQSAVLFSDKMPYNFMLVGLIAALMPKAKIIHCVRDPLETCYSVFKQNFSGSHAYSNTQEELGFYFNAYQSMMQRWHARFPGSIHDIAYEALVSKPEQTISDLLAFCGLDMEPACLASHKNKRAVRTASVAQVRQPIYKDAVRASAPFEVGLTRLREILASGEGGLP